MVQNSQFQILTSRFLIRIAVPTFVVAVLVVGAFLFARPSMRILPVGPDGAAWDAGGATVSFGSGEDAQFLVMQRNIGTVRRAIFSRTRRFPAPLITVHDDGGKEIPSLTEWKGWMRFGEASWSVRVENPEMAAFSRFTLENGSVRVPFVSGAIFVNTNQDIYQPFANITFSLAIAGSNGDPVCDAALALSVTDPSGRMFVKNTEDDSIVRSEDCASHTASQEPDYKTDVAIGDTRAQGQVAYNQELRKQIGTYQATVVADTVEGKVATRSVFSVQERAPMIVTREAPVRVVGGGSYEMTIRVQVADAFSGTIVETLPKEFIVTGKDAERATVADTPGLSWNADLASGETARLSYRFSVSHDRPMVWNQAPLRLGERVLEARAWQGIVEPPPYSVQIPDHAVLQFGDPQAPEFWERQDGVLRKVDTVPTNIPKVLLFWEGTLRYKGITVPVSEIKAVAPWSWTRADGTIEATGVIPGVIATIHYQMDNQGHLSTFLRVQSSAEQPIEGVDLRFTVERAAGSGSTSRLFLTPNASVFGRKAEITEKGMVVHFPVETIKTGETTQMGLTVSGNL